MTDQRGKEGERIGVYEIVAPIGAGGMGEVYLARDVRLKRDVALKVLPEPYRFDANRLARFEREAQLLASLNHPNIATLHGLEVTPDIQALVMEFVDGDTLADRLTRGGLPLATVLTIARQLVDALDTAHERGIVHRDLKPANIKIRSDGMVKVLDFGLAKAFDVDGAGATIEEPTLTAAEQSVVGTPAYMSPEQARGGMVDRRTDIWAFGCVLYEMLTGRRAFDGATASDAIAAVLSREPDWTLLPSTVPPSLRRLLRRCLEKDTKQRLRDIADAREHLQDSVEPVSAGQDSERPSRRWMAIAALLGVTTVAALGLWLYQRESFVAPEPVRFAVFPPERGIFSTPLFSGSASPVGGTISPDGRLLAFTATDTSGIVRLWVRGLDSTMARALPRTEAAALPFWSPDGKSLGFFTPGRLKKIAIADGAIQDLSRLARGRGGSWSSNGEIIFAPAISGPLMRVSASGGEARMLTTLAAGEVSHRYPYFLPDDRHFLYYAEGRDSNGTGIFVGDLDGSSPRRVLTADSAAVYAPSGHVLFVRQGTLFAQAFDVGRLETRGDPVSLATSVPSEGTHPAFSVSDTGVLTYQSGPGEEQQFAWFDRHGKLLETVGPPGNYRGMDLSPDGQRIAVHRHDADGGDIWVLEPRGTTTRVTSTPESDNSSPAWSPDSIHVAFGSLRNGKWGLYQKRAVVTDAEELLVESTVPKIPSSWSSAGIVYWHFTNAGDSYLFPLAARPANDQRPLPLLNASFYEGHAQVSPDGKWIAFMSTETGRGEIHVRPFPSGDGNWQVSTDGGVTPRWGGNGKELFYVTSYDSGKLMAVPFRVDGATFVAGTSQELFNTGLITPPHTSTINVYNTYDVSPDNQRFVIPRPASMLRDDATPTPITVVLNWTAMLKR